MNFYRFLITSLLIISTPLLAQNQLKLAYIVPLSGEAATIGKSSQNGALLAYNKLSKEMQDKIELVFEDDQLNPKHALSAFNRLLLKKDVDVMFNLSSGTGLALAPLAEKEKIPFLAGASDINVCKGKKYTVNFWTPPESEAAMMLAELKHRKIKNIARFSTIHNGMQSGILAFDAINDGSVKILQEEEFLTTEIDFKPYIIRLKEAAPRLDTAMLFIMPGQLGIFARQVREAGIKLPLIGFSLFEEKSDIKSSRGALLNQWYVNSANPDPEVEKEYKKQYPEASVFAAFHGYDVVLLTAAAIEANQGKVDKEQINHFLHTVKNFKGSLGTYSATGDNRFSLPAAVKIVRENGFEEIRR